MYGLMKGKSSETVASSAPVSADFSSEKLTFGAGVAIFHLASSRVVVCYHTRDKNWFLRKGRRDTFETSERGAEREGFEESGYRNRLLPLPIRHRQTQPRTVHESIINTNVTEPIWVQLIPQSRTAQYILYWYIAETLPPDIEETLNIQERADVLYQYPPAYPTALTLRQRIDMETRGWTPPRHTNTGVDAEEMLYDSALLSVDEARRRLKGTIQEDVVRKGWDLIQTRLAMEKSTLPLENPTYVADGSLSEMGT